MKGLLIRLKNLKELEKKRAWAEVVEAERERDEVQERLDALSAEVNAARQTCDQEEAHWAAQRQSWCLRRELERRRQAQVLQRCEAEHQARQDKLEEARQRVEIVEKVIERIECEERIEERRQEIRDNDEIGSMAWWRACG